MNLFDYYLQKLKDSGERLSNYSGNVLAPAARKATKQMFTISDAERNAAKKTAKQVFLPSSQEARQANQSFQDNPITERLGRSIYQGMQKSEPLNVAVRGLSQFPQVDIFKKFILNDPNRQASDIIPKTNAGRVSEQLIQNVGIPLSMMNPAMVAQSTASGLIGGGLGYGIGKISGGDAWDAASRGTKMGIASSYTGPLLSKGVGALGGNDLTARSLTALASVPEGMLLNKAGGYDKYTGTDFAIDAATGFVTGGSGLSAPIKSLFKNEGVTKPVTNTLDEAVKADRMRDALGRYTNKQVEQVSRKIPVYRNGELSEYVNVKPDRISQQVVQNDVPVYRNGKLEYFIPKEQLLGLTGGVEFETDKDGKVVGVKYNSVKGLIGLGAMAGITKYKDIKNFDNIAKATKGSKVEQAFNVGKFDVPKEQEKELTNVLKSIGLDTRNVRSFDEMKALAVELSSDPKKLLSENANNRITDKEVVALGNVIKTSSDRVAMLTKQLKKNPNNQEVLNQLTREETLLQQAIKKRVKGGTELGRGVVAFRIIANKTLDPTYWLSKAQKQIGDSGELTADNISSINDLIKSKDRLGLARYVSMLGESTLREKVTALLKAGWLTSPKTHLRNILSNTAFGALETAKDIPATGFDIARSKLTGTPRSKAFGLQSVTEQGAGAKRGLQQAKDYMQGGFDPREANKFEISRSTKFGKTWGGRVAQKYTDFIFNSLGAEDKVFREAAFNRAIVDQALTQKANSKLSAEELSKLISNPTESMAEIAIRDAEKATFTNENKIASAISAGKAKGGPAVAFAADVAMPFTKTPTNVAARFVDYTPVGILKTAVQKVVSGGKVSDRELADAFGRSATGMGILWAGYELAKNGLIQGPSPSNEAERSQMYLEGKQPNSILINGKWQNVGSVSPVGNLLLLGAAYHDTDKNLATTGAYGVKSLSEQTFVKGLAGALKTATEPERSGGFVQNLVGGVVPTIVNDIGRGTDSAMRDKDTLPDYVKARIPGIRESLPVKVDALGNPIPENDLMTSLFNPFNPKTPTDDPVVLEFSRVGYNLNTVGNTIGDKKLTPEQERAYQKLAGARIREVVYPLINSEAYQSMDKEKQLSAIEKAVTKAKASAREEIKPKLDSITKGSDRGFKVGAYENKTTDPKLQLYGQGLLANPGQTLKAVATGQPIRKVAGDTVVLERQQGLGGLDQGNQGTQVDHNIALALGGSNEIGNQRILTNEENRAKGAFEAKLAKAVANGEISGKEARRLEEDWRNQVTQPMQNATQDIPQDTYNDTISPVTVSDYGIDDVVALPKTTAFERSIYNQKAYSKARKVAEDVLNGKLDQSTAEGLYKQLGINSDDANYYYYASSDTGAKRDMVIEELSYLQAKGADKKEMVSYLVSLRRDLRGKQILSNGVIDDMYDMKLISKQDKAFLKSVNVDKDGKTSIKSSGSGGKKYSAAQIKALKVLMKQFNPVDYGYSPKKPTLHDYSLDVLKLPESAFNTRVDRFANMKYN